MIIWLTFHWKLQEDGVHLFAVKSLVLSTGSGRKGVLDKSLLCECFWMSETETHQERRELQERWSAWGVDAGVEDRGLAVASGCLPAMGFLALGRGSGFSPSSEGAGHV